MAQLDRLHKSVTDQPGGNSNQGSLPPIFASFGQFIDHDVSRQAATDPEFILIVGDQVVPRNRNRVRHILINERTGRLDLESLYGDPNTSDPVLSKLSACLRDPIDPAKMRVGTYSEAAANDAPTTGMALPKDRGGDLPRVGQILTEGKVSQSELHTLPLDARELFFRKDSSLNTHRAVIGDSRNDDNLLVAQMHLALLRLHNALVDGYPHARRTGDGDKVYAWAKRETQLHYQWLIVNAYLANLCEPQVLQQVLAKQAPAYQDFRKRCNLADGDHQPIPIEFSFSVFHMAQSIVRKPSDWNPFQGQADQSAAPQDFMSAFTGNGNPPMPTPAGGSTDRLPSVLGADWGRLVAPASQSADRATRRMNAVSDISQAPAAQGESLPCQSDMARNIRRGVRLNVPAAQTCIETLNQTYGTQIAPLTEAQLTAGPTGQAVRDGGFVTATPLWFYVLKEAEVLHGGTRLGPLGSHVVAETLVGTLVNDQASVLNTSGVVDGRWHPTDSEANYGSAIDSFAALMRAAGLL